MARAEHLHRDIYELDDIVLLLRNYSAFEQL